MTESISQTHQTHQAALTAAQIIRSACAEHDRLDLSGTEVRVATPIFVIWTGADHTHPLLTARRVASLGEAHMDGVILPPIRAVYDRAGMPDRATACPFRAPHHTASPQAIFGRTPIDPGEWALATMGVLYLDALAEWRGEILRGIASEARASADVERPGVVLAAHVDRGDAVENARAADAASQMGARVLAL